MSNATVGADAPNAVRSVPSDVAIIGAGLAGMTAALRAGGDVSGDEIVRALAAPVRRALWIRTLECVHVTGLLRTEEDMVGAEAHVLAPTSEQGRKVRVRRLYDRITNPPEATGEGVAMAVRASARLADLEFVQVHPTALDVDIDPAPLLTEALRDEGGVLIGTNAARRVYVDSPVPRVGQDPPAKRVAPAAAAR